MFLPGRRVTAVVEQIGSRYSFSQFFLVLFLRKDNLFIRGANTASNIGSTTTWPPLSPPLTLGVVGATKVAGQQLAGYCPALLRR